jgi:hypothetical protein
VNSSCVLVIVVNQKLFFILGYQGQSMPTSLTSRTNMASISKVTRNSNEGPSHLTVNEWFHYASSTISAVGTINMRLHCSIVIVDVVVFVIYRLTGFSKYGRCTQSNVDE